MQELRDTFCTRDLSERPAMLHAHGISLENPGNYHAMIGRYLSANCIDLGISHVGECPGGRGARWKKTPAQGPTASVGPASPDEPEAQPAYSRHTVAVSRDHTDIGPQYYGDSPFTARMRFHQSWYRARVLGVPYGTGPRQTDTAYYGNMLSRPDGEKGLNFVAPEAFSVAGSRLAQSGGVVEPFRLLHNMLSSQPMCFNLFGPLATDPDLATLAFRVLLGSEEVQRVSELVLEYAPEPKSEYLNDRTAFDAFASYERPDGQLGFLGIETKLTEPFSQKRYDSPAYRRWVELQDSPWPRESWGRLADTEHNQLWRDHLLAVAMLRHPESPYASGRFALVRHPEDQGCADVVHRYRRLLKPDDGTFMDLPLDHMVGSWQQGLPAVCTEWLDSLHLRYLDLGASEEAWGLRS